MTEEIKVGDWAVCKHSSESFRVAGFAKSDLCGQMLVDEWGFGHMASSYRKYNGATSPLEAVEAATDKMLNNEADHS